MRGVVGALQQLFFQDMAQSNCMLTDVDCADVVEQLIYGEKACGIVWVVHIGYNQLADATLMTHGRQFEKGPTTAFLSLSNGVPVQVAGKKQRDDSNHNHWNNGKPQFRGNQLWSRIIVALI